MTLSAQASDKLLDTRAAAQRLHVEPATVKAWRSRGVGPPYVRVTHQIIRYRDEDLDDWIRAQRVDPSAVTA